MTPTIERQATTDTVLALQFLVAWAGEESQPARLGWWRSDLVDEYGGGDLLKRLLPRTHRWAALESARRVAFLVDRKARQGLADPDSVRTLFFWGFELDEQLADRIRQLKAAQVDPTVVLDLPFPLDGNFDRAHLERFLMDLGPEVPFTTQLSGRELKVERPPALEVAAKKLARALLPLPERYPAPFFRGGA